LYYQNVSSHDELAPGATGSFQTAGQVTLSIPPMTNLNGVSPPGTPTYAETNLPANAFNPFNPFNQIISGGSRARLLEFGNRLFDNETDSFLSTLGVRGDKLFDGTWGYDAGWRYSNVQATSIATVPSTSRFTTVLNGASPIFDPTNPAYIGTTVPFNPFGDALSGPPIPTNAAVVNYATVKPKDVDTSELSTLDFNMYTTSLFKLPAGGVGFAFGAQFRKESLNQVVDQLNLDGDVIGSSPTASTNAGRKDYAFYAETVIPVTSPTWNAPGFYSVEISAGGRYENFRNNNTHVAVPKVGLRWQPFDETFTLRGTWGQGFREPSLIELYGSPTSGLLGSQDPLPESLGGPPTPVTLPDGSANPDRFESETPVVVTSSPVLTPENSASFNVGFVWTPKFVNGLTIEVDGWQISETGTIVQSTPNSVLRDELVAAEGGPPLPPGEIVQRDAGGNITRIFTPFINSGSLKTNGIDMGVQYVLPTKFGTFTSLTNATYVNSYQFAGSPGETPTNLVGNTTDIFSSNDGFLRWKGVSRLDWTLGGWDMVWTARFFDGFHEFKPNGLNHWTSQAWFFDMQISYDFTYVAPVENQPVAGYSKDAKDVTTGKDGKMTEAAPAQTASYGLPIWKRVLNGTQVTIGVDDIFNAQPPVSFGFGGNSTNYPGFLYDATGRFVYFRLTKKF
jgi:iron complex outermembrane receptor protein